MSMKESETLQIVMSENHKDHVFETLKDQQIFEERRILFHCNEKRVYTTDEFEKIWQTGGRLIKQGTMLIK